MEGELARLVVVAAAFEFPGDRHVDLVVAGGDVADVDALHTAFAQRVELLEAVDVVRGELAVDVDLNRVEARRNLAGIDVR